MLSTALSMAFSRRTCSIMAWMPFKFVPKTIIDNKWALIPVKVWRPTGVKSLPEPITTPFTDTFMNPGVLVCSWHQICHLCHHFAFGSPIHHICKVFVIFQCRHISVSTFTTIRLFVYIYVYVYSWNYCSLFENKSICYSPCDLQDQSSTCLVYVVTYYYNLYRTCVTKFRL